MYDALVVGAGPAGVSASIWLKQLGFNPLAVDKQTQCGGLQLSNPYTNTWIATSENAFGPDVALAMHQNMLRHRVSMRLGVSASRALVEADGVSVDLSNGESVRCRFLVLAGGVAPKTGGFAKRLGIIIGPGPSVANTNFDHARVAILGGGDSAFENYGIAKERGAIEVTIFARSIKARGEMLNRVPPQNVVLGEYVVDIDANSVNGKVFDQILVLYGYEANKSSLLGLDLALRPNGLVSTNGDCLTSHPRVYAIGELAGRWHPCCATAMADGVVAAKAIQRRLEVSAANCFAGLVKRALNHGSKVLT
jgi:thioredoxin reductase (NADPH)